MNPWSQEQRRALEELYQRLETRAAATTEPRAWWPCRKGCDHCCRHLADPLPITGLEWAVLWEGFLQLPAEARAEIRARVLELERTGVRHPYTCPFLDREAGACHVYAHRPMACRSYGFAVSRGQGLWCHFIAERLGEHGEQDIVWSNQDALEGTLERLAGPRPPFLNGSRRTRSNTGPHVWPRHRPDLRCGDCARVRPHGHPQRDRAPPLQPGSHPADARGAQ